MTGTPSSEEAFLVDELGRTAFRVAGVVRIGRAPENTVMITDPTVSRLHAEIWVEHGAAFLRSRGSNGTRVNGERQTDVHELREGDRIDVGWSSFRFTRQELPVGIHAASRGIAAAGKPATAALPSSRRRWLPAAAGALAAAALVVAAVLLLR